MATSNIKTQFSNLTDSHRIGLTERGESTIDFKYIKTIGENIDLTVVEKEGKPYKTPKLFVSYNYKDGAPLDRLFADRFAMDGTIYLPILNLEDLDNYLDEFGPMIKHLSFDPVEGGLSVSDPIYLAAYADPQLIGEVNNTTWVFHNLSAGERLEHPMDAATNIPEMVEQLGWVGDHVCLGANGRYYNIYHPLAATFYLINIIHHRQLEAANAAVKKDVLELQEKHHLTDDALLAVVKQTLNLN